MARNANLLRLGMVVDATPTNAQEENHNNVTVGPWPASDAAQDFFIERDGVRFAGTHLIIDLWGASRLDDLEVTEQALRDAAAAAGATLLHVHLHHFTPNGGISGVAVLAESHISIHTWPERGYAALDVFMCGACDPRLSVPVLREAFQPERVIVEEHRRGTF